jgi:Beta-lactamase class C and other penicillin binding proteins
MIVALPPVPADVPFPTEAWQRADPPAGALRRGLPSLVEQTVAEPQPELESRTDALLVVHRGRIVAEGYAAGFGPDDKHSSDLMAKSMLHASVGILVRQGRLSVPMSAAAPEWAGNGDPRAAIRLDQLLHMTSGLRFAEDYVNAEVSDVIKMLFSPGAEDTGAFAAAFPLDHVPDTVSNYSSGTSNIISRMIRDMVGPHDAYGRFLRAELFDRIGMASATPQFDRSGSWIASSFCFCTPRDFARFGLLYLRDGVWDGQRLLPEGWVDYARTPAPVQPTDTEHGYGAHWWLLGDDLGTFFAAGYLGQYIFLVPALDLIVVRNGQTPAERRQHVVALVRRIIGTFRDD